MITKERLEELIDYEKTHLGEVYVFELDSFKEINPIQINSDRDICLNDKLCRKSVDKNFFYDEILLKDIYETKEEAEWFAEFGCIERTERLELPTWEDFWNSGQTIWFTGKDGGQYALSQYNREILLNDTYIGYLDKESYYKACRKCKEIFLGEKK